MCILQRHPEIITAIAYTTKIHHLATTKWEPLGQLTVLVWLRVDGAHQRSQEAEAPR